MSHVEKCTAKLGIINKDLLEAALKVVCEGLGVQLCYSIDSKYVGKNLSSYNGTKFLAAIRTDSCPEGVGVMINPEGKLEFAYDYDGHRTAQKEIMNAIDGNYKALAIGIALQKTGFKLQATQMLGNQTHFRAVR